MMPNPIRVASRYTKRGGIIQAPPEMVEAVSAWVLSSVAATTIAMVQSEMRENQNEVKARASLAPAVREVRNAISNGVKVRSLYDLMLGLWEEAVEIGWRDYESAVNSRPKFSDFSKQYKAGNKWLRDKLDSIDEFIAGRDQRTRVDREDLEEKINQLEGYLVRGGKAPITSRGLAKVFPVSRYMRGWRYKDILQDPSRLTHSGSLQLVKSHKRQVARIKSMAAETIAMQPENEAAIRARVKQRIEEATKKHREKVKQLKASGGKVAFDEVVVILTLARSENAGASWNADSQRVAVYYPHQKMGSGGIESQMTYLAMAVRHELQHMTQTLLQRSLGGPMSAGYPGGGSRTPAFEQWMMNPEKWFDEAPSFWREERDTAMRVLRDEGVIDSTGRGTDNIDFHALDDIEFFTRLQDSIDEAERAMRGLSGDTRNNAIDIWTGVIPRPAYTDRDFYRRIEELGGPKAIRKIKPHEFFVTLKKVPSARRKYTRALKELRKALGYRSNAMMPNPKRVAALHREAAGFDLRDFLHDAKRKAMNSLLRQVEREIKAKLGKSFESAFPDWEMVEVEVEEDTEALGFNEPNRYLSINATVKPKPSHPKIEYIWSDRELDRKMAQWTHDNGRRDGDLYDKASDNGEMGPDLRYYLYFGRFRW